MFLQFLLTHQFTKLGIFLRESWEFNTSGYCWLYVIYLFIFYKFDMSTVSKMLSSLIHLI